MSTLKLIDEKDTIAVEAEGDMDYGQALGLCLDGTESLLKYAVEHFGEDQEEIDKLHDYMTYAFTSIIERQFPSDDDFGLTEAAIFKAQNEILEESMETGKPIDEVIERYNKDAQEYVEERKHVQ